MMLTLQSLIRPCKSFHFQSVATYAVKSKKPRSPTNRQAIVRSSNLIDFPESKKLPFLVDSVRELRGVGDAIQGLLRNLDLESIRDILITSPHRIRDRSRLISALEDIHENETIVLEATAMHTSDSAGKPMRVTCADAKGTPVDIVYFYQTTNSFRKNLWPSMKSYLYFYGSKLIIIGRATKFQGKWQIANPESVFKASDKEKQSKEMTCTPVYALTEGLPLSKYQTIVEDALQKWHSNWNHVTDYLDSNYRTQRKWPHLSEAIWKLHQPQVGQDLSPNSPVRERLAFDELVALELSNILLARQVKQKYLSSNISNNSNYAISKCDALSNLLRQSLPFELSIDQQEAVDSIAIELESEKQMIRFVQGDVGTGKTVVALFALVQAIAAGRQVLFLAPTDLLAAQHFSTVQRYLSGINIPEINNNSNSSSNSNNNGTLSTTLGDAVGLFTGSVRGTARKELLQRIQNKEILAVVGTHALLSPSSVSAVSDSLGLVIIDEEQRFGVEQRGILERLPNANILYTTATPIPRSQALLALNNFSISTIRADTQQQANKRRIITSIVQTSEIQHKIIALLNDPKYSKSKTIWVCPSLFPSSNFPSASATERIEQLRQLLHTPSVDLLHGKLPSATKQSVLGDFAQGRINRIVATSVVEVGIDIPDATICIIDHAERFGLSQLHQIRGRIGRGPANFEDLSENCYCFLITNTSLISSDDSRKAFNRLQYLVDNSDCFAIAEYDAMMRGVGDIYGSRQHGVTNEYFIASLGEHYHLVPAAKAIARQIADSDYQCNGEQGVGLESEGVSQLLTLFGPRARSEDKSREADQTVLDQQEDSQSPVTNKKKGKKG